MEEHNVWLKFLILHYSCVSKEWCGEPTNLLLIQNKLTEDIHYHISCKN